MVQAKRGSVANTALCVLEAVVRPVALYGTEVFPACKKYTDALQRVMNDGLRGALGAYLSTPIWLLQLETGIAPVAFQHAQQLLCFVVRCQASAPNSRTRMAMKVMLNSRRAGSYYTYVKKAMALIGLGTDADLERLVETDGEDDGNEERVNATVGWVKLATKLAIGRYWRKQLEENAHEVVVREVWTKYAARLDDAQLATFIRRKSEYMRSSDVRSKFAWIVRSNRWNAKINGLRRVDDCWLCGKEGGDVSLHLVRECKHEAIVAMRTGVWLALEEHGELLAWHEDVGDVRVLLCDAPEGGVALNQWHECVRPRLFAMYKRVWGERQHMREEHGDGN